MIDISLFMLAPVQFTFLYNPYQHPSNVSICFASLPSPILPISLLFEGFMLTKRFFLFLISILPTFLCFSIIWRLNVQCLSIYYYLLTSFQRFHLFCFTTFANLPHFSVRRVLGLVCTRPDPIRRSHVPDQFCVQIKKWRLHLFIF